MKNVLETTLKDIRAELTTLREMLAPQREIQPNAVYKVTEIAALVQRDEATIYRAIRAGYLIANGGRIVGADAMNWVRAGLLTGKNKGDVRINQEAT